MAVLSSYYDSTFGSIGFFELDGGSGRPTQQGTTAYHIPGSDDTVIIDMGKTSEPFEVPVGVDSAELASLQGAVGNTGTLTLESAGSLGTVKLLAVTNLQRAPVAAWKATLRFL